MDRPLPCIACGYQPDPACGEGHQPHGATMFSAGSGHYGSTVWDEMGGYRSLRVNVCDKCLVIHKDRVAVAVTRRQPKPAGRGVSVRASRTRSRMVIAGLSVGLAGRLIYSGIEHGTWLSFVLAAVELFVAWLIANWSPPTAPVKPEPIPPMITPVDQDDPFCSCPKCHLLGNHGVEVRHQAGLRRVGHGDDWVEIGSWASAAPGPYAHRTCWFCGHEWRTKAVGGSGT